MYKNSIKENSKYLIPFLQGVKYYGSDEIESCIGTMIILNENGDILTCKHIAEQFIKDEQLKNNHSTLLSCLSQAKNKSDRKKIERENNLHKNTVVLSHIHFCFPFEIENISNVDIVFHESLDLAIIRIPGLKSICDNYPTFSGILPEQGQSICKIGYAFPEYDLFQYDNNTKQIVIKHEAFLNFPVFPLDGIVTRLIMEKENTLSLFETSSPGLCGQSGGPIFSPDGLVYGMQSMTAHLDLNFDIDTFVKRGPDAKKVSAAQFINLGIGITSKEIINFLEENKINFNKMQNI